MIHEEEAELRGSMNIDWCFLKMLMELDNFVKLLQKGTPVARGTMEVKIEAPFYKRITLVLALKFNIQMINL